MSDEKQIRKIRAAEKSRGARKPPDRTEDVLWDLKRLIDSGDPEQLIEYLHAAGIKESSPGFERAMRIFYAVRGSR